MNYILFIIFLLLSLNYLFKRKGIIANPLSKETKLQCTGLELLWIFIFSTGMFALSAQAGLDLSALRLMALEIFCVLGFFYCKNKPVFSFPFTIYLIYILWLLIGLSYTPNPSFGIRLILKYLYPFLLVIFTATVVRNKEIVIKGINVVRLVALVSLILLSITPLRWIFSGTFWVRPAAATHYISMAIFSLAMFFYTNEKKKNLLFAIIFCLPCFYWVFRTNIMGTSLAIAAFFLIKYKLKALPLILIIGTLSFLSIFYIPSVKEKMFFKPDEVTLEKYLDGQITEDDIDTSGRKDVWEDVFNWFYKDHELIGSGTGRVQTYFYAEAIGWRKGGQLHNDFLQIMCDNGLIGLLLYLLSVISIFFHCIIIYNKKNIHPIIKICAITAGASIIGVTATMYSDNSVSYSMATVAYPWAFYGITLGLLKNKNNYII